jgi:hypothetical protein
MVSAPGVMAKGRRYVSMNIRRVTPLVWQVDDLASAIDDRSNSPNCRCPDQCLITETVFGCRFIVVVYTLELSPESSAKVGLPQTPGQVSELRVWSTKKERDRMCPSSSGNTLMAEDAAEPGDRKGPQLSLWLVTLYCLSSLSMSPLTSSCRSTRNLPAFAVFRGVIKLADR